MFNHNKQWHLLSIYGLVTAITFQCIPSAKCNILDKYPEDIDYLELISCRNLCGIYTEACSCQSKCRILDNCCEDFKEECPEEYNNTGRIKHLLQASVGCYYNTLMVDQLPEYLSYPTTISPVTSMISTQSPSLAVSIDRIYHTAPVIDLYNGIVFKDRTIYQYYSLMESQPVPWSPVIELKSMLPFQYFIETLFFFNNDYQVHYRSPTIVNATNSCIESALKCPSADYNYRYLVERCNSFLTYTYDSELNEYYRNAYCKLCQNNTNDRFIIALANNSLPVRQVPKSTFAVIVKTTDTGYIFNVDESMLNIPDITWQKIQCDNSNLNLETPCFVSSCHKSLQLSPDKRCKYQRLLQIAIGSNEVDFGAEFDLLTLSSMFWCLLGSRSKTVFLDDDQTGLRKPVRVFHSELNMFSYSFEANVLWLTNGYENHIKTLNTVIDAIVKAIAQYAKNETKAASKLNNEREDEQFSYKEEAITFDLENDMATNPVSSEMKENNRWYIDKTVTDAHLIALACVCVKSRQVTDICSLSCWQTPTFRQDDRNIRQLLDSVCFQSGSWCNELSFTIISLQIVYIFALTRLV